VQVELPSARNVRDAASGEPVQVRDGRATLDLGPCDLRALHIP
jgi:hypothetical protein